MPELDAVFFIQQLPSVEFREGMFHVCYDIGKQATFEVVMSPNVFLKALKRANKASDEFHAKGDVVGIKARG